MILLKILSDKPLLQLPDKIDFMFRFNSDAEMDTKGTWLYD